MLKKASFHGSQHFLNSFPVRQSQGKGRGAACSGTKFQGPAIVPGPKPSRHEPRHHGVPRSNSADYFPLWGGNAVNHTIGIHQEGTVPTHGNQHIFRAHPLQFPGAVFNFLPVFSSLPKKAPSSE